MRISNTAIKLTIAAAMVAGTGLATVGIVRADEPAQRRMLGTEHAERYLEHLRSVRKQLAESREQLKKEEMADRANHRHDALEFLDKAIDHLDEEIATYEKDLKDGK